MRAPRPARLLNLLHLLTTLSLITSLVVPLAPIAIAAPARQVAGATLTILAGSVEMAVGSGAFGPAQDGQSLSEGDSVRTAEGGIALLTFFDGSETQLTGGSTTTITSITAGQGISLFQAAGTSLNRVAQGTGQTFQTDTPTAVGLVRGTAYTVTVRPVSAPDAGGTTAATTPPPPLDTTVTPPAIVPDITPPAAVIPPVAGPVVTYPRVIDDTGYWLMGEAFYPDADGYWQVRTWQDPATASSWDTFERLGLASNLLGEAVYVQDGILWRVRTWRDATDGFSWDTYDSLGSASQSPSGTQQAASVSAAPLGAPTAAGHDTYTVYILIRGSLNVSSVTGNQTTLDLEPGQIVAWDGDTQVVGSLTPPGFAELLNWDGDPRNPDFITRGNRVTNEASTVAGQVLQQGTRLPRIQALPTLGDVIFLRLTQVDPATGEPLWVEFWPVPPTDEGTPPPPPPPPPTPDDEVEPDLTPASGGGAPSGGGGDGGEEGRTCNDICVGTTPMGIAVDQQANQVYVANSGSGSVSVINGAGNGVSRTVSVPDGPYAVGENPRILGEAYVGKNAVPQGTVVTTGGTANFSLASPTGGLTVGVDANTDRIYVTQFDVDTVRVLSRQSGYTLTADVPVGDGPRGVAVNLNTHRAYVANSLAGTVSVIDTTSNAVTATVTVGNGPDGVGVDPVLNRIYVANTVDGTVSVIDGTSNAVLSTVSVGLEPRGVAASAATNRVYVANSGSSTVSVLDGLAATPAVVSTVAVGSAPTGVAVNSATRKVYVANSGSASVSVISESAPTSAAVWSVDGANLDNSGCTPETRVCRTIQAAVDAASPGDTINVAAGLYPENVRVWKPLTISGAGASAPPVTDGPRPAAAVVSTTTTIVDAAGGKYGFYVAAHNVTIQNLQVLNATATDDPAPFLPTAGIQVDQSARNVVVRSTRLTANSRGLAGIGENLTVGGAAAADGNQVDTNVIAGIVLSYGTTLQQYLYPGGEKLLVGFNTVTGGQRGVISDYADYMDSVVLDNNTVSGTTYEAVQARSYANTGVVKTLAFTNNTISRSGDTATSTVNISGWVYGLVNATVTSINITGNQVTDSLTNASVLNACCIAQFLDGFTLGSFNVNDNTVTAKAGTNGIDVNAALTELNTGKVVAGATAVRPVAIGPVTLARNVLTNGSLNARYLLSGVNSPSFEAANSTPVTYGGVNLGAVKVTDNRLSGGASIDLDSAVGGINAPEFYAGNIAAMVFGSARIGTFTLANNQVSDAGSGSIWMREALTDFNAPYFGSAGSNTGKLTLGSISMGDLVIDGNRLGTGGLEAGGALQYMNNLYLDGGNAAPISLGNVVGGNVQVTNNTVGSTTAPGAEINLSSPWSGVNYASVRGSEGPGNSSTITFGSATVGTILASGNTLYSSDGLWLDSPLDSVNTVDVSGNTAGSSITLGAVAAGTLQVKDNTVYGGGDVSVCCPVQNSSEVTVDANAGQLTLGTVRVGTMTVSGNQVDGYGGINACCPAEASGYVSINQNASTGVVTTGAFSLGDVVVSGNKVLGGAPERAGTLDVSLPMEDFRANSSISGNDGKLTLGAATMGDLLLTGNRAENGSTIDACCPGSGVNEDLSVSSNGAGASVSVGAFTMGDVRVTGNSVLGTYTSADGYSSGGNLDLDGIAQGVNRYLDVNGNAGPVTIGAFTMGSVVVDGNILTGGGELDIQDVAREVNAYGSFDDHLATGSTSIALVTIGNVQVTNNQVSGTTGGSDYRYPGQLDISDVGSRFNYSSDVSSHSGTVTSSGMKLGAILVNGNTLGDGADLRGDDISRNLNRNTTVNNVNRGAKVSFGGYTGGNVTFSNNTLQGTYSSYGSPYSGELTLDDTFERIHEWIEVISNDGTVAFSPVTLGKVQVTGNTLRNGARLNASDILEDATSDITVGETGAGASTTIGAVKVGNVEVTNNVLSGTSDNGAGRLDVDDLAKHINQGNQVRDTSGASSPLKGGVVTIAPLTVGNIVVTGNRLSDGADLDADDMAYEVGVRYYYDPPTVEDTGAGASVAMGGLTLGSVTLTGNTLTQDGSESSPSLDISYLGAYYNQNTQIDATAGTVDIGPLVIGPVTVTNTVEGYLEADEIGYELNYDVSIDGVEPGGKVNLGGLTIGAIKLVSNVLDGSGAYLDASDILEYLREDVTIYSNAGTVVLDPISAGGVFIDDNRVGGYIDADDAMSEVNEDISIYDNSGNVTLGKVTLGAFSAQRNQVDGYGLDADYVFSDLNDSFEVDRQTAGTVTVEPITAGTFTVSNNTLAGRLDISNWADDVNDLRLGYGSDANTGGTISLGTVTLGAYTASGNTVSSSSNGTSLYADNLLNDVNDDDVPSETTATVKFGAVTTGAINIRDNTLRATGSNSGNLDASDIANSLADGSDSSTTTRGKITVPSINVVGNEILRGSLDVARIGEYVSTSNAAVGPVNVTGNTITNSQDTGIRAYGIAQNGEVGALSISGNTVDGAAYDGLNATALAAGSATISNNQLSGVGVDSTGIRLGMDSGYYYTEPGRGSAAASVESRSRSDGELAAEIERAKADLARVTERAKARESRDAREAQLDAARATAAGDATKTRATAATQREEARAAARKLLASTARATGASLARPSGQPSPEVRQARRQAIHAATAARHEAAVRASQAQVEAKKAAAAARDEARSRDAAARQAATARRSGSGGAPSADSESASDGATRGAERRLAELTVRATESKAEAERSAGRTAAAPSTAALPAVVATRLTVSGNKVADGGTSLSLDDASGVVIKDNYLHDAVDYGLVLRNVDSVTVSTNQVANGNDSDGTNVGIYAASGTNTNVKVTKNNIVLAAETGAKTAVDDSLPDPIQWDGGAAGTGNWWSDCATRCTSSPRTYPVPNSSNVNRGVDRYPLTSPVAVPGAPTPTVTP